MGSVDLFCQQSYSHKEVLKLMGTRFEITAIATNEDSARKAVEVGIEEIQRIEFLISSWKPSSQTSLINKNAGNMPVKVDKELFELVERAIKISDLTQGAFDISFASMDKIFVFDKKEHALPSKDIIDEARKYINFENILLNEEDTTVFLTQKGMKIGFGGIGKGYAANRAKFAMSSIGEVLGGVINASGDLMVWGPQDELGWPIQITNPDNLEKTVGLLNIKEGSVVTSGDYEKYFTNNGKRYAHIVDPKTGLPTTGVKSVTIVSPDAEFGDALATSIFVLGIDFGINLINSIKNVEALIITDENKLITSKKLELKTF